MIVVYHHLGLGDHIDCNGMVRYFAELYGDETIEIFAKKNYHTMVKYMFRDHDRINVNLIESDEQSEVAQFVVANQPAEFFKIGHEHYPPNPSPTKNCWEYFYEQLDIDTNIKYDYFYVKPDKAQEKRTKKALQQSLSLEDAQQTKEETTTLSASEKKAILGSDGEGEDVV